VRLPLDEDDEEPWLAPPSRRKVERSIVGVMPERVDVVLANEVFIDRSTLPSALVNRLIRLAAFQNPEYYAAQAMRLPTFGKPRVISCAELLAKHIALPRGCLDAALDLLTSNGIHVELGTSGLAAHPLGHAFSERSPRSSRQPQMLSCRTTPVCSQPRRPSERPWSQAAS